MTPALTDARVNLTLAWTGIGVSVVAAAFAVHPVKASPPVFWAVVCTGFVAFAIAGVSHFRRRRTRRPLLAPECRRICTAIKKLLVEQEQHRPRAGRFGGGRDRHEDWLGATHQRYEDELRPWATKVFDALVKAGVLSEASRSLLDAKTPLQLASLRDLFRDAAESLEQS